MKIDLDALQAALKDHQGATFVISVDQLQAMIDRLRKAEAARECHLTDEDIAILIYLHTGINERQFPDEYAEQRALVKATVEACMGAAPTSADSEGEKG